MTSDNGNNGYELPPSQIYTKSIKLESTAKGIRIHLHCYGDDSVQLRKDILTLYCDLEQDLIKKQLPIAKMEVTP
jgi:hypothetical protein